MPSSSTSAGRLGQRCADIPNPLVTASPSRRATAAMRRYLSGRSGAMIPARTIVPSRPSGAIALLADDREATFFGQPAERLLHDLSDVGVDRIDVGLLTELDDHVDRLGTLP